MRHWGLVGGSAHDGIEQARSSRRAIVVVGAAALMDLRPDHGRRTGQLSGAAFNVGITVAILASSLLAQYAPHPLHMPFVVVGALVVAVGIGLLALRETHVDRSSSLRIARPSVPAEIRVDFWFAVLGVMAAWSVLGLLLSLFPTLAAEKTGVLNLVFGGAVVAVSAFAAALVQLVTTDIEARPSALIGDLGMAACLLLTIPAVLSHNPYAVFVVSAALGAAFGLTSGAGWAATTWGLDTTYPWFAALAAVACLAAGWLGLRSSASSPAAGWLAAVRRSRPTIASAPRCPRRWKSSPAEPETGART